MAGKIIALRPHHIDRFVRHYHKLGSVFDNLPLLEREYSPRLAREGKKLFENLASGGSGDDYVLVKNGPDSLCQLCPHKRRKYCREPDSLSLWNGSGWVMQEMCLREGFLYPIKDFLRKVVHAGPRAVK